MLEIRISHETKVKLSEWASERKITVSDLVREQLDKLFDAPAKNKVPSRRTPLLRTGLAAALIAGLFSMSLFQTATADDIILSIEGEILRSHQNSYPELIGCDDGQCEYNILSMDHIDPENYDPSEIWKSNLSTKV